VTFQGLKLVPWTLLFVLGLSRAQAELPKLPVTYEPLLTIGGFEYVLGTGTSQDLKLPIIQTPITQEAKADLIRHLQESTFPKAERLLQILRSIPTWERKLGKPVTTVVFINGLEAREVIASTRTSPGQPGSIIMPSIWDDMSSLDSMLLHEYGHVLMRYIQPKLNPYEEVFADFIAAISASNSSIFDPALHIPLSGWAGLRVNAQYNPTLAHGMRCSDVGILRDFTKRIPLEFGFTSINEHLLSCPMNGLFYELGEKLGFDILIPAVLSVAAEHPHLLLSGDAAPFVERILYYLKSWSPVSYGRNHRAIGLLMTELGWYGSFRAVETFGAQTQVVLLPAGKTLTGPVSSKVGWALLIHVGEDTASHILEHPLPLLYLDIMEGREHQGVLKTIVRDTQATIVLTQTSCRHKNTFPLIVSDGKTPIKFNAYFMNKQKRIERANVRFPKDSALPAGCYEQHM
jgi:hypothetical protein